MATSVKFQNIDYGRYVREKQSNARWQKYKSLIATAKEAVTDTNQNAGIGVLVKAVKGGIEWVALPSDRLMVATVYTADNNYPFLSDIRLSDEFNDFVNYDPAGACFQSRRDAIMEVLTKVFRNGGSILSVGCGSAIPELLALHDSQNAEARLSCIDKAPDAIDTVKSYADKLSLSEQVSTSQEDALTPEWSIDGSFNAIVSGGFAANYLRGPYLTGMLGKFLGAVKRGGSVIVDICYPDTELIDLLGNVLRWPVVSIGGTGLQTFTQDDFLRHLDGDLSVTFYDYIYGAVCVIDKS